MVPWLLALLAGIPLFYTGSNRYEYWGYRTGEVWHLETLQADVFWNTFTLSWEYTYFRTADNAPFPPRNQLLKYALEWAPGPWTLRLGSFQTALGRGLLLYAGEEESALLDRFLYGAYLEAAPGAWEVHAFAGIPRSYVFYAPEHGLQDRLAGGQVARRWSHFTVGTAYLLESTVPNARDAVMDLLPEGSRLSHFVSLFGHYQPGNLELYAEGALRTGFYPTLFADTLGYGGYLYGGYTRGTWTLSLELEALQRFQHPYLLPPAVDRYGVYLTNGDHEVGAGVTLSGRLGQHTEATFHLSRLQGEYLQQDAWIQEAYAALQTAWGAQNLHGSVDWIQFENAWAAGLYHRKELTLEAGWMAPVLRHYGLDLKYQHRYREDREGTTPLRYTDADLTLGVSRYPWADLALVVQRRFGDTTATWARMDAFVHLGNRWDLALTWGKQRQDLVCSGGVCRYEPEFDGFRAKVILRF